MSIINDVTKRHDFVLLFDVTDGNPNGDPDAGNLPRVDPETMQGLVTDVCLKRKVRNYIEGISGDLTDEALKKRLKIYVEHHGILNRQHKRAYTALNINLAEPIAAVIEDKMLLSKFTADEVALPEGFTVQDNEEDDTKVDLKYSGELSKDELKDAIKSIEDSLGKEAAKFAKTLAGKVKKAAKPGRDDIKKLRSWMCENFFDIRMFGAVMTTNVNCGQVRGPIQFTFARSIDQVVPLDLSITRVAITREEDEKKKETEMGRKTLLPYGLYKGYGFVTPSFANDTGVTDKDLELFWEAIQNMWDIDRSASRGMMACRGIYIFSHDKATGNAPAHTLLERVTIKKKTSIVSPRSFADYDVAGLDETKLPEGVTLTRLAV
jgi:CRISPR-associated protein Csd2